MATEIPIYKTVSWEPLVLTIPYGLILQGFYYLGLFIIQNTNAVYFNIMTLCSNFYNFITTVFIFKFEYQFTQIVPIIGIIIGIVIFSIMEMQQ